MKSFNYNVAIHHSPSPTSTNISGVHSTINANKTFHRSTFCIVRRCKSPNEEISGVKQSCCSLQYYWNYLFICCYTHTARERNVKCSKKMYSRVTASIIRRVCSHAVNSLCMQMTVGAVRWHNGPMNNIYRLSRWHTQNDNKQCKERLFSVIRRRPRSHFVGISHVKNKKRSERWHE